MENVITIVNLIIQNLKNEYKLDHDLWIFNGSEDEVILTKLGGDFCFYTSIINELLDTKIKKIKMDTWRKLNHN